MVGYFVFTSHVVALNCTLPLTNIASSDLVYYNIFFFLRKEYRFSTIIEPFIDFGSEETF